MFSVEKSGARMEGLGADISPTLNLRWEFIKENKKVGKQENKNSTKKFIEKKKKVFFLFFLVAFLVESVFSFIIFFLFS